MSIWDKTRTILLVTFLTCISFVPHLQAAQGNTKYLNKADYLPVYLLIAYQYKKEGSNKLVISLVQIHDIKSHTKLAYVNFFIEGRELRYWADSLDRKSKELRQYLLILFENGTPRDLKDLNFSFISSWDFSQWYKFYECLIQKSDPDRDMFKQITSSPPYLFSLKINEFFVKQKMVEEKFEIDSNIADIPDKGIAWIIKNIEDVQSTIKDAESVNKLNRRLKRSSESLPQGLIQTFPNDDGDTQEYRLTREQMKNLFSPFNHEAENTAPANIDLSPLIESNNQALEKLSQKVSTDILAKVPNRVAEAILTNGRLTKPAEKQTESQKDENQVVFWPPFVFLLFLVIITFVITVLYLKYIYNSINRKPPATVISLKESEYEIIKPDDRKQTPPPSYHDISLPAPYDLLLNVKKSVDLLQQNTAGITVVMDRIEKGFNGERESPNQSSNQSFRDLLIEVRSILTQPDSNHQAHNASTGQINSEYLKHIFQRLALFFSQINENLTSKIDEAMRHITYISDSLESFKIPPEQLLPLLDSLSAVESAVKNNQTEVVKIIEGIHLPSNALLHEIKSLNARIDGLSAALPDPESDEGRVIAVENNQDFLMQLSILLTQQKKAIEGLRGDINKNMEEYLYIGGPEPEKPVIETYQKVKQIFELLLRNNDGPQEGETNE